MTRRSCSKRDSEQLQMILKYCNDIEYFLELHGSDEDSLNEISVQYDFMFPIIQMGEHVKRLSFEFREEHKEVDWKGIAGMRDIIVHRYAAIDVTAVQAAILNDVPLLKDACRSILKDLDIQ